ncbi:MAG TPA: hypothetical protein VFU21_26860 [Kofleriaceae bacterium]|nr:hypothetical protein [Kofleriaceae bacterium]
MSAKSKKPAAADVMSDEDFARKLAALTPEQRAMFERALELTVKNRRMLMTGYLATALALVLGLAWALYIYGKTHGGDQFMGWVFLVPPLVASIVLIMFGRLARRLK